MAQHSTTLFPALGQMPGRCSDLEGSCPLHGHSVTRLILAFKNHAKTQHPCHGGKGTVGCLLDAPEAALPRAAGRQGVMM